MVAKWAIFDETRIYRYQLGRIVSIANRDKLIAFIGLNPSTADETEDDPTIRRCMGFARDFGFGSLIMLNLFGYRSTDPKNLMIPGLDPVGPDNDKNILETSLKAGMVIAAWGIHGAKFGRGKAVEKLIKENNVELYCLGKTKSGDPKHPLYLPKKARPETY